MSSFVVPFLVFCMIGEQSGAQLGCIDMNEADTIAEAGLLEPAPITAYSDRPTVIRFGYRDHAPDGSCIVSNVLTVRSVGHSLEPWRSTVTVVVDEDFIGAGDFEDESTSSDVFRACLPAGM